MSDATVSLSGYLPGSDWNGLGIVADKLRAAFDEAYEIGDETSETTRCLVVGIVDVVSVKRRKHPEDKPPVVEVRFERIEPIPPGEHYKTVRGVLDQLRDERIGDEPLPGLDDHEVVSTGGEATSRVGADDKEWEDAAPKGGAADHVGADGAVDPATYAGTGTEPVDLQSRRGKKSAAPQFSGADS